MLLPTDPDEEPETRMGCKRSLRLRYFACRLLESIVVYLILFLQMGYQGVISILEGLKSIHVS